MIAVCEEVHHAETTKLERLQRARQLSAIAIRRFEQVHELEGDMPGRCRNMFGKAGL